MSVRVALRLEGAVLGVVAVALYLDQGYSWLALVLLLLAPDLGALGYLAGNRVGAVTYDLTHFEGWPVALGAVGVVAGFGLAVQLALIWLSHIGIDRAIGYGLKYPSACRDTHPSASSLAARFTFSGTVSSQCLIPALYVLQHRALTSPAPVLDGTRGGV